LEVLKGGAGEGGRRSVGRNELKSKQYYTLMEKGNIPHTIQRKRANWMGHIALELPSKTRYTRKDRRDGKMRKKTKAVTK
jgi:hypothetical protein